MKKSYAAWLDESNPREAMVIRFIEEYKGKDQRNNLRYMLIELIEYYNDNRQVIEQTQNQEIEAILAIGNRTDYNFSELFSWMTQLPDFMRELKKQLVSEIVQSITMNGGQIQFHQLPDLSNESQRRALDEKNRRQQQQINDLLNLE